METRWAEAKLGRGQVSRGQAGRGQVGRGQVGREVFLGQDEPSSPCLSSCWQLVGFCAWSLSVLGLLWQSTTH